MTASRIQLHSRRAFVNLLPGDFGLITAPLDGGVVAFRASSAQTSVPVPLQWSSALAAELIAHELTLWPNGHQARPMAVAPTRVSGRV